MNHPPPMSRFTAGERRGLIVLMSIFALLLLCVVILRSLSADGGIGHGRDHDSVGAKVGIESVVTLPARDSLHSSTDSLRRGRGKKSKSRQGQTVSYPERDPLSEEMN